MTAAAPKVGYPDNTAVQDAFVQLNRQYREHFGRAGIRALVMVPGDLVHRWR